MSEKRLGELSEEEFEGMMDYMLSEEFDKVAAEEFFGALKAMDEADAAERIVIKGTVKDGALVLDPNAPLPVQGNEIRVGKKVIVIALEESVSDAA